MTIDPAAQIRPMTPSDVESALTMFEGVAAEGRWICTEAGFDHAERAAAWTDGLARSETRRSFVVEEIASKAIVGLGSVHLEPSGVAELGMSATPEWRGRGLGGALLDALVDQSRDLGAHKVALQVFPHNARALRLYTSRHFVHEGRLVRHYRRQNGELWDAIIMGLVLDHDTPGSPHGSHPLIS